MHDLLHYNEEVANAITQHKPIVAIESSILSHGMPYPDNLTTVKLIEKDIRDEGAIPATIAIYQGKIHVGIDDAIMHYLATHDDIIKASRRDIAYVVSRKMSASTNVAASVFCAHLSQIPLLITGGIGGVRYHSEEHYEISADLIELSTTPVTVVCSGTKSILDLPKTIEVLETHSVPVIGYKTEDFPVFGNHFSEIKLFQHLSSPTEIAELMHYHHELKLPNGLVVANPIPKEAETLNDPIKNLIKQAQSETNNNKAITPFLLKRIAELTAGQSWHINIELIKNNAILAAKIAVAYQQIKEQS